jgi:ring-1,2-phenylacetyl-CoA epoxidase subunit PaaC
MQSANPSTSKTVASTSYLLHLADSALILGQRQAEWCGHGPVLEQDIAITNITLDLVGQARLWYQYAAELMTESGKPETEDSLAYLRDERSFRNFLITELPNGDWAKTILRQFFFSTYQWLLMEKLMKTNDQRVVAIAEKSIKEVRYHMKWSAEWVIRLGDGTEESRKRLLDALDDLWTYTGEFFESDEKDYIDISDAHKNWMQHVTEVFKEATIDVPGESFFQTGGKKGIHTEYLGFILAEMQHLQRVHPGAEW